MTTEGALVFFVAIFIFSITPGPGVFAILARALSQRAGACFTLSLGMAVSDIIYLILAIYGLAQIANNWEELFTLIRIVGALYLLYLGIKMWQAPAKIDLTAINNKRRAHALSFTQGFLISASNPKVILFYIAFLPGFMDLSRLGTYDIILVSTLTLIALMLGLMLIALSAAWFRQQLKSQSAIKNMNRVAGSIMVGAAAYLGFRH